MPQNDLERRDYFQMQTEFRQEIRKQFSEIRSDVNKVDGKLDTLTTEFTEFRAASKVRLSLYGALAGAIPAGIAVLYMLLKG